MKKRNVILLALLCILVMVVLAAPVSGGLTITDGAKITATDGTTSPVINITGTDIPLNGNITINVSSLNAYVAIGPFATGNVVVADTAVNATWTGVVAEGNLTLTSTNNATVAGETVTVTFTGAGNPWVPDTFGNMTLPLEVTRTDTSETATINFMIETSLPPDGLTVTNGEKIISPYGATSPNITIEDTEFPDGGTITIDVSYLYQFVYRGAFTDANVIINDTAAAANWTGAVSGAGDLITLTSTGGNTTVGENVTVTFTGAGGNPWLPDTTTPYGNSSMPLTVTRTDTSQTDTIIFMIETPTPPPGGLTITDGEKITSPNGATSPVITIEVSDIPLNGTITINVPDLYLFVNSSTFTDANVIINDTAAAATWTRTVSNAGDLITLTSTGGNTTVGENVTVTFTGAGGNPWLPDTSSMFGNMTLPLEVTRTDTFQTASLNFMIETTPPPGGLTITNGANITATDGATSPVITIADADILMDGTITIDVSGLNAYVVGGTLTDANVEISSDAAAANWTGVVDGDPLTLTLTSTNNDTVIGENVTVTFTEAGGIAWIPNTHGRKTIPLTATRTDGLGWRSFTFVIETAPPPGFAVAANFSASPTADIAPLTVTFTDTSLGNPTSWNWSFGDGTWFNTTVAADRNPVYTYTDVGAYMVSLTATNAYESDTKTNYINALNGAVLIANTSIAGLTITNCGGPQTVTVDTSILSAALIPNNSTLEIQPTGSGFKNITLYALNGVGFSQNGNLITGDLTGVHLVTEEIKPALGFSGDIGTSSSFNYSMDLSSYPCNAILSTKIWEGVIPETDNKFRQIADGINYSVVGTAYTAKITKTNFPPGTPVKIHMSVDSSWNTYPHLPGAPGMMFIWRIADDEKSGQILPSTYLYTDPVNNLNYYEADSPLGLSTFGLSSISGTNNPFQIVAFVAAQVISPSNNPAPASGASTGGGSGAGQTTVASGATSPDQSKTVKIYSNDEGTITQATTLQSTDGLAKISLDLGIVARDSNGRPLESLSIRRIPAEELPAAPPLATFSFAGMAYEIGPDGTTFSPAIPLSFTIPQEQGGQITSYMNMIMQPVPGRFYRAVTIHRPEQ